MLMLALAGVTPIPVAGAAPAMAEPDTAPAPTSWDTLSRARDLAAAGVSRFEPTAAPRPVPSATPSAVPAPVPVPEATRTPPPPAVRKPSPRPPAVPLASPDTGAAAQVIAYAKAQIGKPYRYAAAGPDSFDCSGLALAAYAAVGITLPHQTGGILGRGHTVARSELQPGDLVFPSSGHVGIYLGDNLMVHAPKTGDYVRVAEVYAFYTARRLL